MTHGLPDSLAPNHTSLTVPGGFDTEPFFTGEAGLFEVRLGQNGVDDKALLALAAQMRGQGRRVVGHVQIKGEPLGDCHCREMHLIDLASGARVQISENRGSQARGCHLDWSALMQVAGQLEIDLLSRPDVLIINRFGRAEAEGKGMRGAIETALSLDIPVIIGVRSDYAEVWEAFHAGMAQKVSLRAS
ncbi:DUF2478 domain-containing protein [Roseovarius sp. 2305UL8-3]|uniref:DUF2478 domain-containing protein n=1 Tax=Roseovarius conchicola TaxID=3121636 RepID=UPI003529C752